MELSEKFQRKVNILEKCIDLKKQVAEAKDAGEKVAEEERKRILSQEGLKPLKSDVETQSASKYDIAELFSPPRMTEMIEEFGFKGGWSIDDRCTDPITGRTYDLRSKKDIHEVWKMVKRDRPLLLIASPP